MMTRTDGRKAVITLPASGDAEYMNRLSRLSAEERKIIEEKIPVPLKLADEIIMKVLDYHTVPDEEFIEAAKRCIDENRGAFTDLAGSYKEISNGVHTKRKGSESTQNI